MDSNKEGITVDTTKIDSLKPNWNSMSTGGIAEDLSTVIEGQVSTGPSYTVGAVGTSNSWITGTNGIDWSIGATAKSSATIQLNGEDADIKVNGRSLMDAIDALEQRLNILVPNPELEKEWDELRELGERYRELEKKCKEKGEMWKKLKQMPPPEIK